MEESHTFVDRIRFEQEIEKRRGHFALNYLPYNPVGSLSHLDIHHPSFTPHELPNSWRSQLKVHKDGIDENTHLHPNPFSRHNKRPIHPESNKGKRQKISYSGGFSNISMELRTGEERLKFSRIGKSYQEIFVEEDEFEKLLALPNSISYHNTSTYLKTLKPTNNHSENAQQNGKVNRKLVISERFRPMLLLCRILAKMKGSQTITNSNQERCISKIYTIYLLLNGVYNIKAKDLKCKFPLSKQKLKEVFKDLETIHRHYSQHGFNNSSNHYHHHYTSKANTQQKTNINPFLIEQTEHILSSHNLTRRRGLSIYPICSIVSHEIEELTVSTPLWQKMLQHPFVEREDHIRKKKLWDADDVRQIKQEWCDKFGQINYLNANDVKVDLTEWRKETKPRISYKHKFLNSEQTFMKSVQQMRDATMYALEEDALKKGKGYPVWLQNLEAEATDIGVSCKVHIVLSKMKTTFGKEDVKSVPHAKEKLCLLFFSMASIEVTMKPVKEAFKFVLKSILHDNPDCFPLWMEHRDIPVLNEHR